MPQDLVPANDCLRRLQQNCPAWRLDNDKLRRSYRVNGFRSALLVANAIGHLSEAAWHHPEILIAWGKVEVTLWSHDAGGVTERDLALAQRIEALVAWRPAAGEPLEGAPQDAQHAYVLPD
jgi:pterin-4a-carbinolamine dehydratase